MRIFYSFLIVFAVAILFMLPITQATYDFKTDPREDEFSYDTAPYQVAANVTLTRPIYENNTASISLLSSISDDLPLFNSYNITNRQLNITSIAANTTRVLTVTYDIDALSATPAVNTFIGNIYLIWMLSIICLAPAGVIAIFTGRV